eukprot:jgi/Chrzof1/1608/Cz10g14130.t1
MSAHALFRSGVSARSAVAPLRASRRSAVVTKAYVGNQDVGSLIKADHERVKSLYKQFKDTQDRDQRQKYAWEVIREITLHSLAEEEVVYPEIRKKMDAGTRDMLLDDHQGLKEVLVKLDGMKVGDEGYDEHFEKFYQLLNEHVDEEENTIIPAFANAVSAEELQQMGERFEECKKHLPTRPHVLPPNKPPLNVVANAATKPIDAVRDAVRFGNDASN